MQNLETLIESSNGKIFTVVFVKKDKTIRKMVARLGVKKHLKGGECTLDRAQYIIAYDMENGGYRAINRDTIVSLTYQGATIYNQGPIAWNQLNISRLL